jgi:hypothetical protein
MPAQIHAEMRCVRDKLGRLRMLDNAIHAERDPTMWLNSDVPSQAQFARGYPFSTRTSVKLVRMMDRAEESLEDVGEQALMSQVKHNSHGVSFLHAHQREVG